MESAPIFGINRHRINRDGEGVRSLIAFYGCPLNCKYCLNQICHNAPTNYVTSHEIVEVIKIDELYFRHTKGGLTFGGGEPLLYPAFINEVVSLYNFKWNVAIETSLNVPLNNVKSCAETVAMFICDLKILATDKYMAYTGVSNTQVLTNLAWLSQHIDRKRIVVRVPSIPCFSDERDIEEAKAYLKSLGIFQIDLFHYVMPSCFHDAQMESVSHGKSICKYLKNIRKKIANCNGLKYSFDECDYVGPCLGTCPKCDAELKSLTTYINTLENTT